MKTIRSARVLCVRLKNWPLHRLIRRQTSLRDKPLVIVVEMRGQKRIISLSSQAFAAGIRRGMTAAQAKALCADALVIEHDAERDSVALAALSRWMMRFTPVVMPAGLSAIFLDVTGCERVFGSLENIVRQIRSAMARFRIEAKIAVAPSMGGVGDCFIELRGGDDCRSGPCRGNTGAASGTHAAGGK